MEDCKHEIWCQKHIMDKDKLIKNHTPGDDQERSFGELSHASPNLPDQTSFGIHPESKTLNILPVKEGTMMDKLAN